MSKTCKTLVCKWLSLSTCCLHTGCWYNPVFESNHPTYVPTAKDTSESTFKSTLKGRWSNARKSTDRQALGIAEDLQLSLIGPSSCLPANGHPTPPKFSRLTSEIIQPVTLQNKPVLVHPAPPIAKMPRDLLADKNTLEVMPPLSKTAAQDTSTLMPTSFVEERFQKMNDLRCYTLLLNQDDVDDCDWLEHAAFEPHEAATREKIAYRLTTCGELCTGIFSSAYPTSPAPLSTLLRSHSFPSVDSADSDRKRLLLGHIIATKSSTSIVTDPSMDFPEDWRTKYQLTPSVGHNEDGETVCLHSLCVHPDFAGRGLGGVLLRGWVQRLKEAGIAKRVALICRERLVEWYEKAGFKKVGPSECQYGGGGWFDMVLEFGKNSHEDFDS